MLYYRRCKKVDPTYLDENKVKIAVGSHEKFYKKTLPIIIPSLIESGIKESNIIVFIAGCDIPYQELNDNIQFRFLNHNSFENSAFIDIIESDLKSPFWFFIHDTCKVGKNFKDLMLDVPEYAEKVALRAWPSMSIGLYCHSYIIKHKNKLISTRNTNYNYDNLIEKKLWGIPNEDLILWLEEPEKTHIYKNHCMQFLASENWFGENTKRNIEHHSNLDLYKSKSDWHTYYGRSIYL